MPRAGLTILYIGGGRAVRADLDGGAGRSLVFSSVSPAAGLGLAGAVARAIESGGRPASRVWILDIQLWTQTVDLPAAAVEGLSAAQRAQALSYELETLSSIPANDAATDARLLDGEAGAGRRR